MKIFSRTVCGALTLIVLLASTVGCSSQNSSSAQGGGQGQYGNFQGGQNGGYGQRTRGGSGNGNTASGSVQAGEQGQNNAAGESSAQGQILGKVTSVVGNQVELAIGTLPDSGGTSLTLTGETKTLLIPVGLTISSSGSGFSQSGFTGGAAGNAAGGTASRASGGNGNTAAGGYTRTGNMTASGSSGSARTAGGTTGNTAGGTTTGGTATQRSSDFSTITKGMVLRISQKTINGTLTVVRVAVVSK